MDNTLKIMFMNCRGLQNSEKRLDVFNYLREKRYSMYLLQDVHLLEKDIKTIRAEWGYDIILNSISSQSRGVLILLNSLHEYDIKEIIVDDNGNFIVLNVKIDNRNFSIVNIYGPNQDKPNFYNIIGRELKQLNNPYTLIAGDYNLVLDFQADTHNYVYDNNPNAKESLIDLINEIGLVDIWRDMNPEERRYTWRRTNPLKQSRLDFFLYQKIWFNSSKK